MGKKQTKGMTVKKAEDFSEWYTEVIQKAELADYSPVKGFMVIRPHGYSIWERIQAFLDANIKKQKVKNAYFPLLIPEKFFQMEADHAEGFSPEVAWVDKRGDGERLAVRPTSETIMYDMYGKWIRSHRDLPLRINQWANVVRWETKSTKLFLRTREFLWQEGHCVYATEEECSKETELFLEEYRKVLEELLLIPVVAGRKTEAEKFAGAYYTLTLESLMPDGKALQSCTSHNLGQGFAKSFGIEFSDKDGEKKLPWQNSWGLTTRTIGALIMTHGDDQGLVLPPKVADVQVMIVPILFDDTREKVLGAANELADSLGSDWRVEVDDRDGYSPGWKFSEWELKGIPIRVELGPRDLEAGNVVLARRDNGEKVTVPIGEVNAKVKELVAAMEKDMFAKAKEHLTSSMVEVDNMDDFKKALEEGKLILTTFCGEPDCEAQIKDETGVDSRCIPFDHEHKEGVCVKCGKKVKQQVYFAKAY